jgi:hypothetical protein
MNTSKEISRPPIPTAVRRAVMVEAGYKCAIPHCGHSDLDIHHIIPWEKCRTHDYKNLIALCPNCHRKAHKGTIDSMSLRIFKNALVNSFRFSDSLSFDAPAIEIRRKIQTADPSNSECSFSFEFPEFLDSDLRLISRNIEAWGKELLQEFNEAQDRHHRGRSSNYEVPLQWLIGTYEIIRRDLKVISLIYKIQGMYFNAAHRWTQKKPQNFFVNPFSPITLSEILDSEESIQFLARALRVKLASENCDLDEQGIVAGTQPNEDCFSCFTIDDRGIEFIFGDYQLGGYAAGERSAFISLEELEGILKPEVLTELRCENS